MRALNPIESPIGARVSFLQSSARVSVHAPRFMTLSGAPTATGSYLVPNQRSSFTFRHLYCAWLATRTVLLPASPEDLVRFLASENGELQAAQGGLDAVDHSCPPRKVAVTLLCHGASAPTNAARQALDALAHLAHSPLCEASGKLCTVASLVRISALAGADATWFAEKLQNQALTSDSLINTSRLELALRWCSHGGALRTEFFEVPSGLSPEKMLCAMQSKMNQAMERLGAPFPLEICAFHGPVPKDAWVQAIQQETRAFFAQLDLEPVICKSTMITPQIDVGELGVHVRISEAARGPEGLSHETAHHGLLLGNLALQRDIHALCAASGDGLKMPDPQLCLHVCTVQPRELRLGDAATLYMPWGSFPQPISPPGSTLWSMQPVLVPLESALQSGFTVTPCTKASVLPGDRRLERSFTEYFNKGCSLARRVFGSSALDPPDQLPLALPARPEGCDPSVEKDELYALSAFRVDAVSKRITVGDVYPVLVRDGAPPEIVDFLKNAILACGVGAPMLAVYQKSSESLLQADAVHKAEAQKAETRRLQRLVQVAFRPPPPVEFGEHSRVSVDRLPFLLKLAGLAQGASAAMPKEGNPDDFSDVVSLVASSVLERPPSPECHAHARQMCAGARACGEIAALSAAVAVLRSSPAARPATAFAVEYSVGGKTATVERFLPCGSTTASSIGTLIDCLYAAVFFLRHKDSRSKVIALVSVNKV